MVSWSKRPIFGRLKGWVLWGRYESHDDDGVLTQIEQVDTLGFLAVSLGAFLHVTEMSSIDFVAEIFLLKNGRLSLLRVQIQP